jgi:hypothetical protein
MYTNVLIISKPNKGKKHIFGEKKEKKKSKKKYNLFVS